MNAPYNATMCLLSFIASAVLAFILGEWLVAGIMFVSGIFFLNKVFGDIQ